MKKCLTFNNHQSLQYQLKCMRSEMKQQENSIKTDAKTYVANLPKKIFLPNTINNQRNISNPFGKLLARGVNKTVLKKQGFFSKMLAGFFLKKFGHNVEKKLIQ